MVVDVLMPVKNSTECLFISYCIHIEWSSIIIKLNLAFHFKFCIIVVLLYTCYRSQGILSFGHDFLASVQLKPLKKIIYFVPSSITLLLILYPFHAFIIFLLPAIFLPLLLFLGPIIIPLPFPPFPPSH